MRYFSIFFALNVALSLPAIAKEAGKTETAEPLSTMTIVNLNNLIRRHPEDYVALYRRGKIKEETNLSGALRDFKQSLAVNPLQTDNFNRKTSKMQRTMRAWAFQDVGYIYCAQGKFQQAVDCLTHAIVLRPNYADNFQNRGMAYQRLGKTALAKKDFQQAADLRLKRPEDDLLQAPMRDSGGGTGQMTPWAD